jgi:hypothetical protein
VAKIVVMLYVSEPIDQVSTKGIDGISSETDVPTPSEPLILQIKLRSLENGNTTRHRNTLGAD